MTDHKFEPFEKVLVRDEDFQAWIADHSIWTLSLKQPAKKHNYAQLQCKFI